MHSLILTIFISLTLMPFYLPFNFGPRDEYDDESDNLTRRLPFVSVTNFFPWVLLNNTFDSLPRIISDKGHINNFM